MKEISFGKFKEWFKKYERHISSGSLITGFIVDSLTLKRIDLPFENLVLFTYLSISAISICLFNLYSRGKFRDRFIEKYGFVLPVIMQFAFGGLFSGFFVFYSRSASIFTSWPYLLILVGILIFGELRRDFYRKPTYQLPIFFIALFSFLIFYIPVLIGKIGVPIFLLSGVLSFIIFLLFIKQLKDLDLRRIKSLAFLLLLIINLFYFLNVLPPIPLSLKEGGIYKSLSKVGNEYNLLPYEKSWLDRWRIYEKIFYEAGTPVYAYSSVFAPTDLKTQIVHEWQYNEGGEWKTVSRIPFNISGGRDGGYRGYSFKIGLFPGKWRINVETSTGQVIGTLRFKLI